MTLSLALLVVIIAVALFLFNQISKKKPSLSKDEDVQTISYPYQKQNYLLTKAERSFFGVLQQAVGNDYYILSKVRLADLLKTTSGLDGSQRQSAQNRINSKHVDFVLCNPSDFAICFVIELDDGSHEKAQRQQRDNFVDKALGAAGVPILHIPVKQAYSLNEVKEAISKHQGRVGR
ncbi:MAG: DUF2726 domain-containing protein [Trueperaceae bacterium]